MEGICPFSTSHSMASLQQYCFASFLLPKPFVELNGSERSPIVTEQTKRGGKPGVVDSVNSCLPPLGRIWWYSIMKSTFVWGNGKQCRGKQCRGFKYLGACQSSLCRPNLESSLHSHCQPCRSPPLWDWKWMTELVKGHFAHKVGQLPELESWHQNPRC